MNGSAFFSRYHSKIAFACVGFAIVGLTVWLAPLDENEQRTDSPSDINSADVFLSDDFKSRGPLWLTAAWSITHSVIPKWMGMPIFVTGLVSAFFFF
jgi:hypothetical protein